MNTFLNKTTALRFLSLAVILAFLFGMDYLSTVGVPDDTASLTAALGKPKPPPVIPAEFDVPAGDLTYHKREGAQCFTPVTQCLSKEYVARYPKAIEAKGKQAACYNPKMRIWALDEVILHANDAINNLGIRLEASKATLAEVSKMTEEGLTEGFGVTLIPAGFDEPLDIPGVNGISYQCISGGPIEKIKDTICGSYNDQYMRTQVFVDVNQDFINRRKYAIDQMDEYNKNEDGPALGNLIGFMKENTSSVQIISVPGLLAMPEKSLEAFGKILDKLEPYSTGGSVILSKDNECSGVWPKHFFINIVGINESLETCGAFGTLKGLTTYEINKEIKAYNKRLATYKAKKVEAEKAKQKILDTTPAYCRLGSGTATPPPSKKDK